MTALLITVCIFLWVFSGIIAASSLIGMIRDGYEVSVFGPLNVYDKTEDKELAAKINARRKFFLTIGGVLSCIFMLGTFAYIGVRKLIEHICWMFW